MVRGRAADRFVVAAARLFAERGYARTPVAEIQLACGLTAGSGALYKHFRSKQDLLEAVVDSHIATMRAGARWFADEIADGAKGAEGADEVDVTLSRTAEAVLDAIRRDRDAVRVMLRELDAFPELRDRMWSEVQANVYTPFATWFAEQAARGGTTISDPHATAITLMASLTSLALLDALIDRRPGDLDRSRFIAAWVSTARAALTCGPR